MKFPSSSMESAFALAMLMLGANALCLAAESPPPPQAAEEAGVPKERYESGQGASAQPLSRQYCSSRPSEVSLGGSKFLCTTASVAYTASALRLPGSTPSFG
jgi:hypothetical protein